jgi:hypothetical protein
MEEKEPINEIRNSSIINESKINEEKKEIEYATLLFELKSSK